MHTGFYGPIHVGFLKTLQHGILRPRGSVAMLKYPMVPTQYGISLLFVVEHISLDLPSKYIISYWAQREHNIVQLNRCWHPLMSLLYHQSSVFQNSRVSFQLLGNLILSYLLGTDAKPLIWLVVFIVELAINLNYIQLCDPFLCYKVQI